jgi:hypothetical protein
MTEAKLGRSEEEGKERKKERKERKKKEKGRKKERKGKRKRERKGKRPKSLSVLAAGHYVFVLGHIFNA